MRHAGRNARRVDHVSEVRSDLIPHPRPLEATLDVMEQVERRLSFTGLTIDSDPSLRMQTRPSKTGIAPGAGKTREDFGLSGFKGSPRKSRIKNMRPASTQSTVVLVNSSGDDDDIDLFGSQPRTAKVRTTTASGSKAIVEGSAVVTYKGQVHTYHPDYLPKPKLPNFKKSRSTSRTVDDGDNIPTRDSTPSQPQQSNPPPKGSTPIPNGGCQIADRGKSPTPPLRSSQSSFSPPKTRSKRPRPRPTVKSPTRILRRVDSSDGNDGPVGDRVEEEEVVLTEKKERPKATKRPPALKHAVRAHPLLNDPTFQSDQPLRAVLSVDPSHSPRSSPELSPIRPHDTKGKDKALVVSDDDVEDRTEHAPQPFPLSTSFMNSTPKASKRHPEDETHSEGSERKKLKESLSR